MLGDELLELGLDVVVGAVRRAARRQRRAGRAGARRGARVGRAGGRERLREVGVARLEAQARQAQLRELDGAGDDHVGPAAAAPVGDVEARALEARELRVAGADAHERDGAAAEQLRQRGDDRAQRDPGARAGAGAAAGLDDERAAAAHPALHDLAAAEAARARHAIAVRLSRTTRSQSPLPRRRTSSMPVTAER